MVIRKKKTVSEIQSDTRHRVMVAWTLGQFVDSNGQSRLQVGSLVLMDDAFLGQAIQHRTYLGQHSFSLSLVRGGTKFADGIACSLGIVTVVQTSGLSLTDSLQR